MPPTIVVRDGGRAPSRESDAPLALVARAVGGATAALAVIGGGDAPLRVDAVDGLSGTAAEAALRYVRPALESGRPLIVAAADLGASAPTGMRGLIAPFEGGALAVFREAPAGAHVEAEADDRAALERLVAAAQLYRAASAASAAEARAMLAETSESRLVEAIEALLDGFVLYGPDDRLAICNRRYRELYAESAPAMVPGAHFEDILKYGLEHGQYPEAAGREQAWLDERLRRHRAPGEPIEQELPGDRWLAIRETLMADGSRVGVRVDITTLKRQQRTLQGMGAAMARQQETLERQNAVLARQHTTLERMVAARTATIALQARELQTALDQERAASRMRRDFVAMANHELRTPLALIDGSLRRLRRALGAAAAEDAFASPLLRADRAIVRMLGLIERTLAAAKLESREFAVVCAPCDLAAVLREVCERQGEVTPSHRIALDGLDGAIEMYGDAAALDQVFSNLVTNAVKYSPNADRVDVAARIEPTAVVVTVRDFGVGIDAEDQAAVFDRFFRAKSSAGFSGTGIGLNVAKMLVERHGGTISVTSRRGEGSTFTVSLPIGQPRV